MLMMLAVFGFVPQLRPADSHDADSLRVTCPKSVQLMLMMLAVWGYLSKVRPADAHDAGSLGLHVQKAPS